MWLQIILVVVSILCSLQSSLGCQDVQYKLFPNTKFYPEYIIALGLFIRFHMNLCRPPFPVAHFSVHIQKIIVIESTYSSILLSAECLWVERICNLNIELSSYDRALWVYGFMQNVSDILQ